MDKIFYEKIGNYMKVNREKKHWSINDIENILKAKKTDNWEIVKNSKLYKIYGGEYCCLLQVINSHLKNIETEENGNEKKNK